MSTSGLASGRTSGRTSGLASLLDSTHQAFVVFLRCAIKLGTGAWERTVFRSELMRVRLGHRHGIALFLETFPEMREGITGQGIPISPDQLLERGYMYL